MKAAKLAVSAMQLLHVQDKKRQAIAQESPAHEFGTLRILELGPARVSRPRDEDSEVDSVELALCPEVPQCG